MGLTKFELQYIFVSALERDCDKKSIISCHDLPKHGKPHTNAETAPLGGRPVSALHTSPPLPCDYTGYDPPKKHTNRRWKSLEGTWAACGTRSPQISASSRGIRRHSPPRDIAHHSPAAVMPSRQAATRLAQVQQGGEETPDVHG